MGKFFGNRLVQFIGTSGVGGFLAGLLGLSPGWSLGLGAALSYLFIRLAWPEYRHEDGEGLGTILGLSTLIVAPSACIGYVLATR